MRRLHIRHTEWAIDRTASVASIASHARGEAALVTILIALFLLLGTFARDPWKADEPYCVGIVQNMLQHGQWLVPYVGATPFLEKPPLMFWSAAATAWLFGRALPFIDAARLAVIAWMSATALALGWAATAMHGAKRAPLAIMLMLGAIGLWQHSHKLLPDVSQLAGATLALAAVVRFAANRVSARNAGLLAGVGIGIAFMSKGLLIPGICAVTAMLLPACDRRFRTRGWATLIGWAAIAALPWLVSWPALLYHASPTMFVQWLWDNNVDRFLGIRHHGEEHPSRAADLASLIALGFPASVLAVAALGQTFRRRKIADAPMATIAVTMYALALVVTLELSASLREIYFLPLYPAFALLATGYEWPPRISSIFRRVAFALFATIGVLFVSAWAMLIAGRGEQLPAVVGRWLPLHYVMPFQPFAALLAIVIVACWLLTIRWRHRLHSVAVWFAGATLAWGLANSLLLPWLDTAKSYRDTFDDLARTLPADTRCITTFGFGPSERAMLLYYTGRMPYDVSIARAGGGCSVMIVMLEGGNAPPPLESTWQRFWAGARAADCNRRFIAYRVESND